MKIGDTVVIIKELSLNGIEYKPGYKMKIVGPVDDTMPFRGWDLEDEIGNKIYETLLLSDIFYISLKESRDKKLKDLGI